MAKTTQTVCDIATENPGAVRVFEKYGIAYCCGGQVSLADACAANHLNVDDVIASLGAAADPPAPGEKDWAGESLARLSTYIVGILLRIIETASSSARSDRLTLARKIAAITLTLSEKGKRFDAELVKSKAA